MAATEEVFLAVQDNWDLERLYNDLTAVKQQFGKRRKITPLEKACLRGLLCGYGPNEIAGEINREPRGLRVDLSRGLYRYVEMLTEQPLNGLRDWRDIADWLEKAGYKLSFSNLATPVDDSLIKIVDVSISGSNQAAILDIKVRNVGNQVAFLKKIGLEICQAWILQGCVFSYEAEKELEIAEFAAPQISRTMSRSVEPSGYYELDLPSLNTYNINLFSISNSDLLELDFLPYSQDFEISQCVAERDVDRFCLALSVPNLNLEQDDSIIYNSFVYELNLKIIYDEDNKDVSSSKLILWLEPEYPAETEQHFFAEDYPANLEIDKCFPEYQEISRRNKDVLAELAMKEEPKSAGLEKMIRRYRQLAYLEKKASVKVSAKFTNYFSSLPGLLGGKDK